MLHARSQVARAATTITAVVVIAVALAGCRPEPEPSTSSSAAPSRSATPSASGTPSPTATTPPTADGLMLPDTCDGIYTPAMLATLNADVAPLNDPGTTMVSSENVVALEVLESGAPTIRCTWGPPSERGIATNVTVVSPDQSAALATAFTESGFGATELDGGTLYEIQRETVTLDDELVSLGESHYLRGDGWISTRWINVHPEGYTPAIAVAVWG